MSCEIEKGDLGSLFLLGKAPDYPPSVRCTMRQKENIRKKMS